MRTIVDVVLGFWPDFITHQLTHLGHEPQWTGLQPYGIPAGNETMAQAASSLVLAPLAVGLVGLVDECTEMAI